MTPKDPTDLDTLAAYAEGYAEFAMKNIGRVPPTMLAISPEGLLHFIPESLEDERAKNDFANIGRLICAAYGATNMVMILESWMEDQADWADRPRRHRHPEVPAGAAVLVVREDQVGLAAADHPATFHPSSRAREIRPRRSPTAA